MTGLDHEKQTLVEIAAIVTDQDLNVSRSKLNTSLKFWNRSDTAHHFQIVAEGPDIVINQPESVLEKMEEWPRETFIKNGLLNKIRESKTNLKTAEDMVSVINADTELERLRSMSFPMTWLSEEEDHFCIRFVLFEVYSSTSEADPLRTT